MNKKAFTMIELVFVIVILGILAGVALPKLSVTRDDATTAKMRADVSSIRSGIALQKSKYMMEGNISGWRSNIKTLVGKNFSGVVQGGIKKGNSRNGWTISDDAYEACIAGKCATFALVGDKNTSGQAGDFICTNGDCNLFE